MKNWNPARTVAFIEALALAMAIAAASLLLPGCTSMTVTYPDGRVVKTTSQDPAVVSAIVTGVTNGAIQAGTAYLKREQGLAK